MKTTGKIYSLTLCFLIPALMWVVLEMRVPSYKKSQRLALATDSINRVFYMGNTKDKGVVQTHPKSSTLFIRKNTKNYNHDTWRTVLQTQASNLNNSAVTRQPEAASSTEDPVLSSQHIIVILSYMRSGSTLTADILQHAPGTVYVFEPFHSVMVRTRQGKPLHYLNGTIRHLKEEDLTDDFLIDELHKWFTCSFDELDVHSLSDNFHDHYSRSMKTLTNCLKHKRRTVKALRECLPRAIDMCQQATHLLFKFIRLPMGVIEDIFTLYSNLQVVHLLRDPRGLLTSQIRLNKTTWGEINDTSSDHCERVWTDLNSTVYLSENYPDQVRILSYESLAENPLSYAERLYRFLGLPFRDALRAYIARITLAGRKDSRSFSIIRGNSTKTAYFWRDSINFTDVQIIDNNCKRTYQFLGYQTMPSAVAVADHSIPTFISPNKSIII